MRPDGSRDPAAPAEASVSTGFVHDRTLWVVPPRQRTIEPVKSFDPTKLLELRKAKSLSHDTLVEAINARAGGDMPSVNRPQLIGYEKGKRKPGIDVFQLMATELGVDPFELMSVDASTATLADLRARAGLNKATTAAHLDMATTSFDAIERGRRGLRPEIRDQIAQLLGTRPAAIDAAHQRGIAQDDPASAS